MKMSEKCRWLHKLLESLPMIRYPFDIEKLPSNGIYFFYEERETWGHGADQPRIVRIGTSGRGNLRSRISEHFLLNEKKMKFDYNESKPSDRSIFRKNIGRALLNRESDPYLEMWNKNFTRRRKRERFGHLRGIDKERGVEARVTALLRTGFSFRFVMVEAQELKKRLEACLIGTVAQCELCRPSADWLGQHSPKDKIGSSGLWQIQHLLHDGIEEGEMGAIRVAVSRTKMALRL